MPSFFDIWLPLVACTVGALFWQPAAGMKTSFVLKSLLTELGAFIIWAIYWLVLYPAYFTPFRHLPTPAKRSPIYGNRKDMSPNWLWQGIDQVMKDVPNNGLIRLYESLSREVLLVTSIDAIREMTSEKPYDFGHPKIIKYLLNRVTSSDLNFLSEHGHKLFRKSLRPAFSMAQAKLMMPEMWDKAEDMVRLMELDLKTKPEAPVESRDYIRRVMWDISGQVALGYDFETLRNDGGIRDQFSTVLSEFSGPAWIRLVSYYVDLRPLLSLVSPLFSKTPLARSLNYIRGEIRRVVSEKESVYQKAKSPEAQGVDITSVSVASKVFPTEELIDNGMLFMTAGPNSSGTALEWSLLELDRLPEIQARLRAEVNECISSTSPGDSVGPRLQALPYLTAFVNEVIRCYPFIPLSARASEKHTSLLGTHLAPGVFIMIPTDVLNQDEGLWGPDAKEFNPDRWLGPTGATGGATSNYAMLSFGAGPNVCIGQHIARAMMGTFLAALLHRFDVKLANPDTAARLQPAMFKRSAEGMKLRLTPLKV